MKVTYILFGLLSIIILSFGANLVVGQEMAPDFTLFDIDERPFTLSGYIGKVVLLDFFNASCGPCLSQVEHLTNLYRRYLAYKLVILSISVDPDRDIGKVLKNYARQNEITWSVARDTANVSDKYGVSSVPHLVIVDAERYIRYDHAGLTKETTLSAELDSLFSEMKNNGSNGDYDGSGTEQPNPPYLLIAVIGGTVIIFLIIGIIVAGQLLGRSKPTRAHRQRTYAMPIMNPFKKRLLKGTGFT